MSGSIASALLQAGHYRQLAMWTSDDRTHTVLLEMACELEAEAAGEMVQPVQFRPEPLPRPLS